MLLHVLSAATQWLAGAFLGFVGVVLMGDFRSWYRLRYSSLGEADAAGCLFLVLYVAALAVIRWLH